MKVEVAAIAGSGGYVRLTFTGDTRERQWLSRARAFLGCQPDGDYFEFEPPAEYLGIKMKRRPYQEHELVSLDNAATVDSDDIELRHLYDLSGGGVVNVRYRASHPLGGASVGGGPFDRVESDWVALRLVGADLDSST